MCIAFKYSQFTTELIFMYGKDENAIILCISLLRKVLKIGIGEQIGDPQVELTWSSNLGLGMGRGWVDHSMGKK